MTRFTQYGRRGACALASAVLWLGAVGISHAESGPPPEDVVLLHGLGRSERAMRPLAREIAAAGYRVHNLDYPSTSATPEELVEVLHGEIASCCAWSERVSFVTHSLGGVVLRAYLAEHPMPQIGRVVMLAPPNHGSEYADVAGRWRLFASVAGPTAVQLGTAPTSLPNRLPGANFEVGVIAGTGSINPLATVLIEGVSDGTVSVASTQLAGMRDFIEMPVSHTFIMRNRDVAHQAIAFLQDGHFAR